jgi:hypothetical protein
MSSLFHRTKQSSPYLNMKSTESLGLEKQNKIDGHGCKGLFDCVSMASVSSEGKYPVVETSFFPFYTLLQSKKEDAGKHPQEFDISKIDFLTLGGLNKALSKGIIIGVPSTSHADLKMMILQLLKIFSRGILNPSIIRVDPALGRVNWPTNRSSCSTRSARAAPLVGSLPDFPRAYCLQVEVGSNLYS